MNTLDYNCLINLIPLPGWIFNFNKGSVTKVNINALKLFGCSEGDFIGTSLKDIFMENDPMELQFLIEKNLQNEYAGWVGDFSSKTKSGLKIKLKVYIQKNNCLKKEDILFVCQDITEEEERNYMLGLLQERLDAAAMIAKLGHWRLQLDRYLLSWTDEAYSIWGRERENFNLGVESLLETILPEDREMFKNAHEESLSFKKDIDIIYRIVLPDSSIRHIHQLGHLVKRNGESNYVYEGTVQNVTAEKLEEQRLKLLESVTTNTSDAVLIIEADQNKATVANIIYVNEAFTKITGYDTSEVIGKTPEILDGPNSDIDGLNNLFKKLQNREGGQITTLFYKKNKEEFWVDATVSPVADINGNITHYVAIGRDVTQQKNKELEKDLLNKISLDFSNELNLDSATKKVCKTISDFGNFDLVELWIIDEQRKSAQLFMHHLKDFQDEVLYEAYSETSSMPYSIGLVGKVWEAHTMMLWGDVEKHKDFCRKELAKNIGLKASIGLPLTFKNEVLGVLIVGQKIRLNDLEKYINLFEKLEGFIGSEINRKRLEHDLGFFYQTIPDILCLTDFQGRFLKINQASCRLLGYSEKEILYKSFEEFLHPNDREATNKIISHLKQNQNTVRLENRYLTKTGETIWLSWTSNSSLKEKLIYGTAKNITNEKKLRELNVQANKLAKIGSWEIDLIQHNVFWSEMVYKLHETDPIKYCPKIEDTLDFYRKDYQSLVQSNIEESIFTGNTFDLEAILVTSKNNERWVRVIGNVELENGKCTRIFGSIQDIHTPKTMEIQIREILGSISDAFYALDSDWNFTYFNKEAENLLLKKEVDIIGKNIWEIFPNAKGTLIENLYLQVMESGQPATFEYLFPGDGNWYEINAYPSDGGLSSYFKNIHERKQSADQLKMALLEKNTILESIGDAFFSLNNYWIITYWNKEAENIFGKVREKLLGKNILREFPKTIGNVFKKQFYIAMVKQENINFETHLSPLDKWFEVSVYPSENSLSVYLKDVSFRKDSETRLREANERFEKVTEATNDTIWDWDLIKKTFYRSKGIEKLFGESAFKSMSENDFWKDNFHPDFLPNIIESINKAIEDPTCNRWEMEYKIFNNKGEIVYVNDRGLILRNEFRKAIRMVGAMTDITERKLYEQKLLKLNESIRKHARELEITNVELEQFAYIASHDLHEPLRMITGFLDQLKRKYGTHLDDKAHQYIEFASDGAKRMKQIIMDLLDYSKAGKVTENIEKIDINEVIDQYIILRKKIINKNNVSIKTGMLPVLNTCKAPIIQTIHCLIDNAIKYTSAGRDPNIFISAKDKGDFLEFRIEDNGIGIDEEFYEKIFIIFRRLHNRDEYPGTGMGLAIVKKHVELWKGKVWVESILDKGSTFYFTHPKEIDFEN